MREPSGRPGTACTDLEDPEAIESAFVRATAEFGVLDALVNVRLD
jgi:NAD(P)-dependent dehydrogenase (short-subunit alcohol dehydrogenase family)